MGDTNYISGIVKVLENPKQKIFKDNIAFTRFRAQFSQSRGNKKKVIHLAFWGKLATQVAQHYKVNDYLLIEGYLAIMVNKEDKKAPKKMKVSVFKVFPLHPKLE